MTSEKVPQTRILVVDDHPLMREALCAVIEDEADLKVIGEATNGIEAIQRAQALNPDVIVMDIFLPGKSGLEAIAEIKAQNPSARILALTSSTDENTVLAAVQAGVLGYLLKDSNRGQLLNAIRQVSQGNSFLSPDAALKLANSVRRQGKQATTAPVEPLTERELEVLRLVGRGASNREIAQALNLTEGTVRTHVHNILGKLGLANRNQALLYAVRQGLVDDKRKE
jgi:two-component system, NarL family, response regulator LiaR